MAKDNKKLVQAITSQEENFAQWYTDICVKAELVEYSSVKGFIILRPYGQAIWELIQKDLDARFKATGHENVAMPVLIPESLLQKEGELVNGFAPEVAWVTMGGSDKLEERLAVRPTSETMFCDHWSRVLHSYRELPMKYNQWCSVVRWEKTTRPFLRSREFWWQEGHTIHETAAEAEAETQQQLNCYADTCEQDLAIPVVKGRKTDKEKFAGAEATYTIEAMMKDHKALQSGTSHYFGDKFSRAYDVTFTGRDNKLQYPFQTSWSSGSGSAVWGAERRRPPAHPILEPSGLPAQWPGRVGRAADAVPTGEATAHHRGAAAGPGGLAAAEAGERLSGGDWGAAADGGEHRAAAGRRGAGAYPLPAGIPGLPGRGDVLRGRELLHLLLRAGSGAGGSVRDRDKFQKIRGERACGREALGVPADHRRGRRGHSKRLWYRVHDGEGKLYKSCGVFQRHNEDKGGHRDPGK